MLLVNLDDINLAEVRINVTEENWSDYYEKVKFYAQQASNAGSTAAGYLLDAIDKRNPEAQYKLSLALNGGDPYVYNPEFAEVMLQASAEGSYIPAMSDTAEKFLKTFESIVNDPECEKSEKDNLAAHIFRQYLAIMTEYKKQEGQAEQLGQDEKESKHKYMPEYQKFQKYNNHAEFMLAYLLLRYKEYGIPGDFENAKKMMAEYAENGNEVAALLPHAIDGNTDAQFALYKKISEGGNDFSGSLPGYRRWFKSAQKGGSKEALFRSACEYIYHAERTKGAGIGYNEEKCNQYLDAAEAEFKKLSAQGDARAKYMLALLDSHELTDEELEKDKLLLNAKEKFDGISASDFPMDEKKEVEEKKAQAEELSGILKKRIIAPVPLDETPKEPINVFPPTNSPIEEELEKLKPQSQKIFESIMRREKENNLQQEHFFSTLALLNIEAENNNSTAMYMLSKHLKQAEDYIGFSLDIFNNESRFWLDNAAKADYKMAIADLALEDNNIDKLVEIAEDVMFDDKTRGRVCYYLYLNLADRKEAKKYLEKSADFGNVNANAALRSSDPAETTLFYGEEKDFRYLSDNKSQESTIEEVRSNPRTILGMITSEQTLIDDLPPGLRSMFN